MQKEFAEVLDVGQPVVSAWERGVVPGVEMYVRLANFAAESGLILDAVWFLGQAGMKPKAMSTLVARKGSEHSNGISYIQPMNEVGPPLPFPAEFVLSLEATRYLIATSERGDFARGDIVVFDQSATEFRSLWGKLIIVESTHGALMIGRLEIREYPRESGVWWAELLPQNVHAGHEFRSFPIVGAWQEPAESTRKPGGKPRSQSEARARVNIQPTSGHRIIGRAIAWLSREDAKKT